MNFKPNSEKLGDFHGRLASFKGDLTLLLTQQAVLITSSNTTTLQGIEDKIDKMFSYYAGLKDEPEAIAEEFIIRNGGEDAVLKVSRIIVPLLPILIESIHLERQTYRKASRRAPYAAVFEYSTSRQGGFR